MSSSRGTMVFTPSSGGALSIEPQTSARGAAGIFFQHEGVDQFFPISPIDETYAESPDTEGGPLVTSKPQNAVGSGSVVISGADPASFRTYHQQWQKVVEAIRREGGTLQYTPPGARVNMVPQPSPELSTSLWTGEGRFFNNPSTLTRDTATAQFDGVGCWKVVTSGTNNVEGFATSSSSGMLAVAGVTYTASIYVKGNAGGEEVRVSAGASLTGSGTSAVTTLTTGWTRISVTFTATGSGAIQLAVTGPAAHKAQTFYADCALIEEGAELLPFFPTVSQLQLNEVLWSGNAWESRSTPLGTTVTYELESMHTTAAPYDGVKMLGWVQEMAFEFTCRPYGLLTSVEQTLRDHDPFSRDTVGSGEWAPFDAGAGTLKVEGGQLVPTSSATKILYRNGIKMSDGSATFQTTVGASAATGNAGVIMKRADANNYLRGTILFTGASSILRITKILAGVATTLVESAVFTTTANTVYWGTMSAEGNTITFSQYAEDPALGGAPARSVATTLTSTDITKFGAGVWGNVGMRVEPNAVDWRFDEWRMDSTQFRSSWPVFDFELPSVPGHVDGLGALTLADVSSQSRSHAEFGLEKAGDYSSSVAPPNIIDSDQLQTAGFAGVQKGGGEAKAGSFDPTQTSAGTSIRAALTQVPLTVCGTGPQSHTGPYRSKVRVFGAGSGPMYVRSSARFGGGPPTSGEWKRVPVIGEWCEVDLGINVPPATLLGTQNWELRLEALSETAGDTIDVDYVMFLGAGRYAKTKVSALYESVANVTAQDSFTLSSGTNLAGNALGTGLVILSAPPATTADNAEVGTQAWSNVANAKAEDEAVATAELTGLTSGQLTHYLIATKFGFAVPVGATITGMQAEVRRRSSGGGKIVTKLTDGNVRIVKAGVVVAASTDQAAGGSLGTAFSTATFGGEGNMWGTTISVAEANAEGFGVALAVRGDTLGNTPNVAEIDAIRIRLWYTPSGGSTWTESGHEAKFVVDAGKHRITRTAEADVANTGRFALAGTVEPTATVVQADVSSSATSGSGEPGVFARYTAVTSALVLMVTGSPYKVKLMKFVSPLASSVELQKPAGGIPLTKVAGQTVTLRLQVDTIGRWIIWADGLLLAQGYDEALNSTGSMKKGQTGFYGEVGSPESLLTFDNFFMWAPEQTYAIWAGRRLQFRWADAQHENSEGQYWSPAVGSEGSRLRIPPAGPAGLTSRMTAKARRTNVDENVDPAISDELQVGPLMLTPRVVLLG